jgi:hypothetical protein
VILIERSACWPFSRSAVFHGPLKKPDATWVAVTLRRGDAGLGLTEG